MLLAVFKLELEMDYPSETDLCAVAPSPTDTPYLIFSEGRVQLYTGYLKPWIIERLDRKLMSRGLISYRRLVVSCS